METVRQRLNRIVADQFQVDPERITDSASIDGDLRATSLDRVEVIMALEDEFAITIFDEDVCELRTVRDLLICVTAHLNRQLPATSPTLPSSARLDPLSAISRSQTEP
jgi:acyl carrier protein